MKYVEASVKRGHAPNAVDAALLHALRDVLQGNVLHFKEHRLVKRFTRSLPFAQWSAVRPAGLFVRDTSTPKAAVLTSAASVCDWLVGIGTTRHVKSMAAGHSMGSVRGDAIYNDARCSQVLDKQCQQQTVLCYCLSLSLAFT